VPGGRRQPFARAMRETVQRELEVRREEASGSPGARGDGVRMSRRDLLRAAGATGAGFALAACTPRSTSSAGSSPSRTTPHDARVVIVGAGLAGVTAAYRLAAQGVNVRLFEARDRVGGRCWTARGFAQGQTAEHGGEFIDTRHVHLRGLAGELGLELDDLWAGYPSHSAWPNWVGGRVWSSADVNDQLGTISSRVVQEAKRIGVIKGNGKPTRTAYSYGTATPAAVELDWLSMADWLGRAVPGVVGSPFGAYLDEVMASWYGLDMAGLSALNWIDYFVIPAPGADERWRVRGGNDQVPNLAAERLPQGTLTLGAALTAMRRRTDGSYELAFDGAPPTVADLVILATPFTTLRSVELSHAGLSEQRLAAIGQLDMGADVKLLLQYDRRPFTFNVGSRVWSGGMEHSTPNFETWESSTDEKGSAGLITVYAGGATGASWKSDVDHGPAPKGFAREIVGHIDEVVPGTAAHFDGTAWLDLWTRDRWTGGSYAAFGPTQMTRFWGYTASPESNVHFAGEHTSTYSQGYLNGGVESGQRAAIEVMRTLGIPVPHSIASMPYSPTSASSST
jgi:monoamine oxidase